MSTLADWTGTPNKFKIVVSDLHLGAGFRDEGNALEDFDSDGELAALLDVIAAESTRSGSSVELIIAGDAFEMLQVPHTETFEPKASYGPAQYHSTSEPDSVRKMKHVIAGHRAVFDALARFIQAGGDGGSSGPPRRCVTFVKGNHDLNIHWPAVQDQIRQAVAATGVRSSLVAFEERQISREGIYVEHGNQYAESMSRVPDMQAPYNPDDPAQLVVPSGSWFVTDFLNQVERSKYWVDGVKPILALIWYSLVYDYGFAAQALGQLFRALPGVLDNGILAVRDSRADLVRQLENPVRVEQIGSRYASDEAYRGWFNAEIGRLLPPLPQSVGPSGSRELSSPDAVAMGERVREQIRMGLSEAAQRCAEEANARVVVFGHTHQAGVETLAGDATYINCGTWTWWGDFSSAGTETWRNLFEHPEWFTGDRLLSYVRIDYSSSGEPTGQLLTYIPGRRTITQQMPPSPWQRLLAWLGSLWRRAKR